jgi:membrane-bound serine protease (ClpP class)
MIALLALTGILFIFLEFFLPGAIMAIGGTLMLLASLMLFYFHVSGALLFLTYLVGLGIAIMIVIRVALLRIKRGKVVNTSDQEGFQACSYPKEFIGCSALVISDLKPSGYVEIDGRSFAALSKLGYVDKGVTVRVIGGQGAHLIVDQEKIHHGNSTISGANR